MTMANPNPQEHGGEQTKYQDLSDFSADDFDALYQAASASLSQQRLDQDLLHSHCRYARLPL